jgi:hypothetical protein
MRRPRVAQPEQNNTSFPSFSQGKDLAKIEVESHNDPRLSDGFRKDLAVRQSLETLLTQVRCIMPLRSKPANHAHIHSHIGKDAHELVLLKMHLFLSQPGCIFNRLLNVFTLQVWVSFQDLFKGCAMGDLAYEDRDRNPHASDACSASHDLWIERDSIKHWNYLLDYFLPRYCQ